MTWRRRGPATLLRWYPRAWRQRYGDELVALMEDDLDARPLTIRLRASTAWAGTRERLHRTGLVGDHHPPAERARTGSLLVLCAWTAFVLAGASFSKASEHFAQAVPAASRALPQDAFDAVAALGVFGAVLVALGAIVALPAFVRFLGGGGWPLIRGHVRRATVLTVILVGALLPLSAWARHLTVSDRNGGDGIYSGAIGLWALLVAATLAQWTAAVVAAARRLDLSGSVLRFETGLAVALAAVMVAITAATALWWEAMATSAPWFLQGTAAGTRPSPFTFTLIITMVMMLAAVLVAAYGVLRVERSRPGLRAP